MERSNRVFEPCRAECEVKWRKLPFSEEREDPGNLRAERNEGKETIKPGREEESSPSATMMQRKVEQSRGGRVTAVQSQERTSSLGGLGEEKIKKKRRRKKKTGQKRRVLGGRLLAGMKCERNAGVREICPERSLAWRRAGFVSREIWRPTRRRNSLGWRNY